MIKHKVTGFHRPMYHVAEIELGRDEVSEIQRLLSIRNMEEMTDEELEENNCAKDTCKYIFGVEFDDGAKLDWKLCSGTNNYFDDVLFQGANSGWTDLDCTYELDNIEVDTGSDIYQVKLVITDD